MVGGRQVGWGELVNEQRDGSVVSAHAHGYKTPDMPNSPALVLLSKVFQVLSVCPVRPRSSVLSQVSHPNCQSPAHIHMYNSYLF